MSNWKETGVKKVNTMKTMWLNSIELKTEHHHKSGSKARVKCGKVLCTLNTNLDYPGKTML